MGRPRCRRSLQQVDNDGRDVKQARNASLVAMGYSEGDVDVDRHLEQSDTASALEDLSRTDWAVNDTGTLGLGSVVFLPGPRRIATHAAET